MLTRDLPCDDAAIMHLEDTVGCFDDDRIIVNSVNVRRFLRLLFNFGRGCLLWKGTVVSLSTNRSRRIHVLMSFSTESEQDPQNLLTF